MYKPYQLGMSTQPQSPRRRGQSPGSTVPRPGPAHKRSRCRTAPGSTDRRGRIRDHQGHGDSHGGRVRAFSTAPGLPGVGRLGGTRIIRHRERDPRRDQQDHRRLRPRQQDRDVHHGRHLGPGHREDRCGLCRLNDPLDAADPGSHQHGGPMAGQPGEVPGPGSPAHADVHNARQLPRPDPVDGHRSPASRRPAAAGLRRHHPRATGRRSPRHPGLQQKPAAAQPPGTRR